MTNFKYTRPAVVFGLCPHGLAITRALAGAGVPVHVIESNLSLPGTKTRYAIVHHVGNINTPDVIDSLIDLHGIIAAAENPVIFPMNDNIVRVLANNWEPLRDLYLLSWAESRTAVLNLLDKINLESHCKERDLLYPETFYLNSVKDIEDILEFKSTEYYPVILKPSKPLSSFKVKLVHSYDELCRFVAEYNTEFPLLLQRWVPGKDSSIFFGALYLDKGKVVARFEGRKLRSQPLALGQTTVAISYPSEEIYLDSLKFFEGTDLSGPVSVEFKRDYRGSLWVIEPTVGRTDYWIDCCIKNGVDFPVIEYYQQSKIPLPYFHQNNVSIWYDVSRDTYAYLAIICNDKSILFNKKAAFVYFSLCDLGPFFASLKLLLLRAYRYLTFSADKLLHGHKRKV